MIASLPSRMTNSTPRFTQQSTSLPRRFTVVGLLERLPETLALFAHVAGWDRYYCAPRKNVHTDLYRGAKFSMEQLSALAHSVRHDLALYMHVEKAFDQQIRVARERYPSLARVLDMIAKKDFSYCNQPVRHWQ